MARPVPASASRVPNCMAVVTAGRAATWHTAVPSRIWRVWAAIHASGVMASVP